MAHIAYVNGKYLNHADACVHIEDRGYQFADGVYEYIAFYNGILLDAKAHLERFDRSLKAIQIETNACHYLLPIVMRELIERNGRTDGAIYLQITRGVSKRDHPYPKNVKPAIVATLWGSKTPPLATIMKGAHVVTAKDERWGRCNIKSVSLLANVIAKQESVGKNAREVWFYNERKMICEGAASNAYIINDEETLITHPADNRILGGIARDLVLQHAKKLKILVEERPFSIREAHAAKEAFLTSTSANILPVTSIDDAKIGDEKPGAITLKLLKAYHEHIYKQTGKSWAA